MLSTADLDITDDDAELLALAAQLDGSAVAMQPPALVQPATVDSSIVPADSVTPALFDYLRPDYAPIWARRVKRIAQLQASPDLLAACKAHYKHNIADFIDDWGVTVNPKNAGTHRPIIMPFKLFPKQREFIDWFIARWLRRQNGVLVKSRECGASWLAMAMSCSLCLFWDDISIGFGSAKEEKVDRSGDPDSLFYKGRTFVQYLPPMFKGEWTVKKHSAHMRMQFPATGSSITGDAGDNIGVGGRKTIYVVDEYAIVERPKLIEANLSANTDTRIEMSTVRGIDNTFAEHARGGKIPRFDFSYRDDPTKTNLGAPYVEDVPIYDDSSGELIETRTFNVQTGDSHPLFQLKREAMDEVIFNQEYGCDFFASIEGGVIEQTWIHAAIGAAQKLGVLPSGPITAAFDVADLGADKNAVTIRQGVFVLHVEQWSGSNIDPVKSILRAFEICDRWGATVLTYDASGMGGSWRTYFAQVNEKRVERRQKPIKVRAFQGGAAVIAPTARFPGADRKNEDYFENLKAQCWMNLRVRFMETFKALQILKDPARAKEKWDRENIISLPAVHKELNTVTAELAQPTRKWSKNQKLMIDKTPDGVASPNIADSVMMVFGYHRPGFNYSDEALDSI